MQKKNVLLFLLTLLISGIIGFLVGGFPEITRWIKGYSPDQIIILSSSPIFPENLLQDFERKSGKTVVLKIIESYHLFKTEAQKADLLFAPYSWTLGVHDFLSDSFNDIKIQNLQSEDFKSTKLDLRSFFPILWEVKTEDFTKKRVLEIYGFSVPLESSGTPSDFIKFLCLDRKRLLQWSEKQNLGFTLKISNDLEALPANRRASGIRDYPLSELDIDATAPQ